MIDEKEVEIQAREMNNNLLIVERILDTHEEFCECYMCEELSVEWEKKRIIGLMNELKELIKNCNLCLWCRIQENEVCDHMDEIEPCTKCNCLSRDHEQDDKGDCLKCYDCDGLEVA